MLKALVRERGVTMLMVALFAGALGPAARSFTLNRQISSLYTASHSVNNRLGSAPAGPGRGQLPLPN